MSVYTTRPVLKLDSSYRPIQDSSNDLAFQADYGGGSTMIYQGFARPGGDVNAAVWQLAKHTYDGSGNILTTTWPINSQGVASSEYEFIWANRASYTYA